MSEILTSWKEIAQYVGKGVRTVQRWEKELNLPVRRPSPKQKHIVMAFPEELDRWLHEEVKQAVDASARLPVLRNNNNQDQQQFRATMSSLIEQMAVLQRQVQQLRKSAAAHREQARAVRESIVAALENAGGGEPKYQYAPVEQQDASRQGPTEQRRVAVPGCRYRRPAAMNRALW